MKRVTDQQLEEQIKAANAKLKKLQEAKAERLSARRNKLAEYLETKYQIRTIQEFELFLQSRSIHANTSLD